MSLSNRTRPRWHAFLLGAVTLLATDLAAQADLPRRLAPDVPLADVEVLLIGNSHSANNDLPGMIERLLEAGHPGNSANAYAVRRWAFLDEHLQSSTTHESLEGRAWTHVILQAQKYSTTGKYYYPTDAAEEWVRRVRARGAVPILFPEWPRRGNTEEGQRIHALHAGIAARAPACVAPVGYAWEIALERWPDIRLYAPDGNHSSRNGVLLTAYVLVGAITGESVLELPVVEEIRVDGDVQALLRRAAAGALEAHPACASLATN